MKRKIIKGLKIAGIIVLVLLLICLFRPTYTPKIAGDNSISELRTVEINGADIQVLIRGCDINNPVILFVHGGPCCSEIPYARKYQTELEKYFTIVHYDQRGSGKSYKFGTDYSSVTTDTHMEDLIELTKYVEDYLGQEKVILTGHSFGTYIATLAVAKEPDLYQAYIGIGQMSDSIASELNNLELCIEAAKLAGNEKDVEYLSELASSIADGKMITPRQYVRKYGFAARHIDELGDYVKGYLFGTEYNLMDAIGFWTASLKYQDSLTMEALENPITERVTELNIPVYFVMGKYDGMTSPKAAEEYLDSLTGDGVKEMVIFENSAHYPHLEECEAYCEWLCDTFIN